MKHLLKIAFAFALTFVALSTFAKNPIEIRFGEIKVDPNKDFVAFEIQLRNSTNQAITLSGGTLRFTYDMEALGDAVIQHTFIEKRTDHFIYNNSTWSYTFYDDEGRNTIEPNTDWYPVVLVAIPIETYAKNIKLDWQDCGAGEFPCTYLTEYLEGRSNEGLEITKHANEDITLSDDYNFPPDVLNPHDQTSGNDIFEVIMEQNEELSFCLPVANQSGDKLTYNVIQEPFEESIDPEFAEVEVYDELCLSFNSTEVTGSRWMKFSVCDEGDKCDEVRIKLIVGQDVSVEEVEKVVVDNKVSVYPNPATTYVNLDLSLYQPNEITYNITNSLGQVVAANDRKGNSGSNIITVDVSKFAAGIYNANISIGDQKYTEKIVVVN